jgi:hypothetical protein
LDVDVIKSSVDLLTWLRLVWVDDRLAWNPEDYAGLERVWFWIADGIGQGETSEIWTPDIELWNQMESVKSSFASSYAEVEPNGRVFWSRPGHLIPVCKFGGLEHFPFDTLVCTVELGSWSYSGKYLKLEPLNVTGFSIGGSDTSGESFQEFSLENITSKVKEYPPYPADPLSSWPVLLYNISFDRSHEPYIRGYLVSQVVFNILGFSCFWMPIPSGERLGLAITAMLSAVAADLVVVSKLPSASELTWMQKFSLASQVFAAYCVIEGVVVSYFFYQTAENLVPSYLNCLFGLVTKKRPAGRDESSKKDRGDSSRGFFSSKHSIVENQPSGSSRSDRMQSVASMHPRDANDFLHNADIKNNNRWKQCGERVDDFSRAVIPIAYLVVLAVFFSDVVIN